MAITIDDTTEAEIRLALKGLPGGFWEVWTSNSYRRITAQDGPDGGVLSGTVHHLDGCPDLSMNEDELTSMCLLVNRLRLALGEMSN